MECKKDLLTGHVDVTLQSRVLLLNQHTRKQTAANIYEKLDKALCRKFKITFAEVMAKFILVTDWAATLPCLVGASFSIERVPLGVKWIDCVVYSLNKLLKSCVHEYFEK